MFFMGFASDLLPQSLSLYQPQTSCAISMTKRNLECYASKAMSLPCSVLLKPQAILAISDSTAVLDRGTIVHAGTAQSLKGDKELLDRLLGVSR
jgi:ABC-type branched-subunit amino acid transport system ATPase component